MSIVYTEMVSMEDGVELYTIIVLPGNGKEKYPTIILRTPYASTNENLETYSKIDTCNGYARVYQHCRGTGLSKGICVPYINERKDGLKLLEWIRRQSFYNGELFLQGTSYLSSVHFSYIDTDPGDIKGAILTVQDSCRYNILYRNGFFKTGLHGGWAVNMYKKNMDIPRNICPETWRTLPLAGITRHIFNETDTQLEEELLHPDKADVFWQTAEGGGDYADACEKCSFPILLVTAFYDIYTEGVFDMWDKLSEERKKKCALLVTPFEHSYDPPPRKEPSDIPDFENGRPGEVCPELTEMWFEHCRIGSPLHFIECGKTTYYRLFDKKWLTAPRLNNGENIKKLYLTDSRKLHKNPPETSGCITYTYNPFAPASFEGGVCNNFGGMKVQSPPDSRYDIISFESDPIIEEMICEGKIEVDLQCSSTAPDTCFYVRLDYVRNGIALSLRDDIDSLCRMIPEYTPGEKRTLTFTFAPHAFKLLPGDKLRLDVSSSCQPYFQIHTNRRGLQSLQTGADICKNTIHTGESLIRLFTVK